MQFTSTVFSKDEGPFATFSEAFTNFWTRFTAMVKGGCPRQALDWCWITGTFDNGGQTPLLWEDARNFAYEVGLLAGEGELQNPAPEVDPDLVELAFVDAGLGMVSAQLEMAMEIAEMSKTAGAGGNEAEVLPFISLDGLG